MIVLISVVVLGLILFLFQEKRAIAPMMPFSIWKYRVITVANLINLTTGMILLGVSSYLPAFVQGVMGQSAMIAGFTLKTMSIVLSLASKASSCFYLFIGYIID